MTNPFARTLRLVASLGFFGLAACGLFPPGAFAPQPGGAPPVAGAGAAHGAHHGGAEADDGSGGDAPALAGYTGNCLQVAKCYVRLAKDFCSGASDCQFKMSIQGNDQDGCRKLLLKVPEVVKPLAMIKPGYALPPECHQ